MKKTNWGKKFENNFKDSAKSVKNIIVHRTPDQVSFQKNSKNISDFYCYQYPFLYYLELKSTAEDKLPIARISHYQFTKLSQLSEVYGVKCGVLIEFRLSAEVWYIDIAEINKMVLEGKKTIILDEVREIGIKLEGKLKKVNYKYEIEKFFHDLKKKCYKNEFSKY